MDKFGLLGQKLGHSYSPQIHSMLYSAPYELCEVEPDELGRFLNSVPYRGLNVTIPYKKAVIPLCGRLSDTAARIGSVNTLVRKNGVWCGYNTDYCGFEYMLRHSGYDPCGKKAVILGNGGVSPTVRAVLEDAHCGDISVISRTGKDNYGNLSRHGDANIVVNATPVGMYPNNGIAAVDLQAFPKCEAVFDLIYNPAKTALLMQAEKLGLIWENGLGMLVAQAKKSAELFLDTQIDDGRIETISRRLGGMMKNIVLIGMPGCGKSTIGAALAKALGKEFADADEIIANDAGMTIPDIFAHEGEAGFRARETKVLADLCSRSGYIVATGGGCVTKPENRDILRQNGMVVWIKRDLELLPSAGRPLSQRSGVKALYEQRKEKYADFADFSVDNSGSIAHAVETIKERI